VIESGAGEESDAAAMTDVATTTAAARSGEDDTAMTDIVATSGTSATGSAASLAEWKYLNWRSHRLHAWTPVTPRFFVEKAKPATDATLTILQYHEGLFVEVRLSNIPPVTPTNQYLAPPVDGILWWAAIQVHANAMFMIQLEQENNLRSPLSADVADRMIHLSEGVTNLQRRVRAAVCVDSSGAVDAVQYPSEVSRAHIRTHISTSDLLVAVASYNQHVLAQLDPSLDPDTHLTHQQTQQHGLVPVPTGESKYSPIWITGADSSIRRKRWEAAVREADTVLRETQVTIQQKMRSSAELVVNTAAAGGTAAASVVQSRPGPARNAFKPFKLMPRIPRLPYGATNIERPAAFTSGESASEDTSRVVSDRFANVPISVSITYQETNINPATGAMVSLTQMQVSDTRATTVLQLSRYFFHTWTNEQRRSRVVTLHFGTRLLGPTIGLSPSVVVGVPDEPPVSAAAAASSPSLAVLASCAGSAITPSFTNWRLDVMNRDRPRG
jgi:hypothetical protein